MSIPFRGKYTKIRFCQNAVQNFFNMHLKLFSPFIESRLRQFFQLSLTKSDHGPIFALKDMANEMAMLVCLSQVYFTTFLYIIELGGIRNYLSGSFSFWEEDERVAYIPQTWAHF